MEDQGLNLSIQDYAAAYEQLQRALFIYSSRHLLERIIKYGNQLKKLRNKSKLKHPIRRTSQETVIIYKCNYCQRSFEKLHHLKVHVRIHRSQNDLKCALCLKNFVSKKELNWHSRVIHKEALPFVCSFCGKKFSEKRLLDEHKPPYLPQCLVICEICKLAFTNTVKFQEHWDTHESEHNALLQITG